MAAGTVPRVDQSERVADFGAVNEPLDQEFHLL